MSAEYREPRQVELRDVLEDDLSIFFEHQLDPDSTHVAAFPSRQLEPFLAHWTKIRAEGRGRARTIVVDGAVAGSITSFEQGGERQVGYWIGKPFWGRGVATRALAEFLVEEGTRPVYAHVAKHNVGSVRVLEKCGFVRVGEVSDTADGVVEVIFRLVGGGDERARDEGDEATGN